MRVRILLIMLIFSVTVNAQTALSGNYYNQLQQPGFTPDSAAPAKKWFVTKSIGISSSFIFSKGAVASVQSVPFSIQLNRRLSDNWYAFGNLTLAPSYTNFNQSFMNANANNNLQNKSFMTNNRFDMYAAASAGLMYVNDQKTFSISGSISVERNSYPLIPYGPYPAAANQPNQTQPQPSPSRFVKY